VNSASNPGGGDRTYEVDSLHIGLHNGIWSGWFSETPIIPMSWWWDSYIDKYTLWHEYASLSHFAERMKLGTKDFSFWNPETKDWQAEAGKFIIHVGSSSRDIRLEKEVDLL
jgi:hypothetical protein